MVGLVGLIILFGAVYGYMRVLWKVILQVKSRPRRKIKKKDPLSEEILPSIETSVDLKDCI